MVPGRLMKILIECPSLRSLVERLAIALNADGQRDGGGKEGNRPYFWCDVPEAVSFEQDAPGDRHETL